MTRKSTPLMMLVMSIGCTDSDNSEEIETVPAPALEFSAPGSSLTDLAAEAVDKAPLWLQGDLALSLHKLDEDTQDDLASLIVDIEESRLIDEIAFSIAHLSPEILENSNFYPQLLVENAQQIYDRDADLAYVEILDEGEPGVDADYWSTTQYLVEDADGNRIETLLDREVYYWYLVHPRMEDEYPYYIDGWASCSGAECASNPDDGMFWREFLWDGALEECPEDRDCPVVRDYVTDESVEVLWKSKTYSRDDNGAIGALIDWEKAAISFGAGEERPVQPNRIYAVGCGNCGEWADMATAAARTALIPSQNVGARANDHTWNEFWDEGWMQWEPVNTYVGHWTYYQSGEGETSSSNAVYAITSSRGDGLVQTDRTVDYGNTFELTVEVLDSSGLPVDGAVVTLYGPILVYSGYEDYWWYAAESTTGPDGLATMTLGENNAFAYRVDAPIGSSPEEEGYIVPFLDTSTAGQDEFVSVTIAAEMPLLPLTEVDPPEDGALQLSFSTQLEHRLSGDSYMLRGSFSQAIETGFVERFIVDEANYALYTSGEVFEAFAHESGIVSDTAIVDLPAEGIYRLVYANDSSTAVSSIGSVLALISSESQEWEDGIDAVSIEQDVVLLPGEHIAVELHP
jgi:hypothetical protein